MAQCLKKCDALPPLRALTINGCERIRYKLLSVSFSMGRIFNRSTNLKAQTFWGGNKFLTRLDLWSIHQRRSVQKFGILAACLGGESTMFLLNQRFVGNLLKKYRKNAKKSCFFYIQESLGGMDKIDTIHLVRNFARNLINVKFFSKKSILTSI